MELLLLPVVLGVTLVPVVLAALLRAGRLLVVLALCASVTGIAAVGLYFSVFRQLGGDSAVPVAAQTALAGLVALALAGQRWAVTGRAVESR
jgi:hypothetical protein